MEILEKIFAKESLLVNIYPWILPEMEIVLMEILMEILIH